VLPGIVVDIPTVINPNTDITIAVIITITMSITVSMVVNVKWKNMWIRRLELPSWLVRLNLKQALKVEGRIRSFCSSTNENR
jgi:hypothetical protein